MVRAAPVPADVLGLRHHPKHPVPAIKQARTAAAGQGWSKTETTQSSQVDLGGVTVGLAAATTGGSHDAFRLKCVRAEKTGKPSWSISSFKRAGRSQWRFFVRRAPSQPSLAADAAIVASGAGGSPKELIARILPGDSGCSNGSRRSDGRPRSDPLSKAACVRLNHSHGAPHFGHPKLAAVPHNLSDYHCPRRAATPPAEPWQRMRNRRLELQ